MPAIFVSHSNLDRKDAGEIKQALSRLGFERVFLDFDKQTGIGAGENWERRLYDELSRCHAVILVLTPNWLASTWCRIELSHARALGKVILPIICEPIGDRYVLPEIQSVDIVDWKGDGLEKVEQRLRTITNELARGFTFDPSRPPYPGIHPFEAEDAAIYFGRDEEARAIIERLEARRTQGVAHCLVIIGASGSGKSSLLKAGVLPQLLRRRRDWLVLPTIRPERAPMEALAKAIAAHLGKADEWRAWQRTLGSPIAADQVAELVKDLRIGEARSATVLLAIDQFEEAFTVASATERAAFLQILAAMLDHVRDLPVMVIATGRSDVLEGLIETGALASLMESYPLPPMPLERVPRLVEGPAAVASLNVEKGLAETITHDVESPEALPLLAHTLWLLYRRCLDGRKLTLAEYQTLGDPERRLNPIQNSIRLTAEEAVAAVKPAEHELVALRDAFVPHLVRMRLDDGKWVRHPATLSELPDASLRLVRALVEARLLSSRAPDEAGGSSPDGVNSVIEVSHEALFKAWPKLDQWLAEEQIFLSDLERIKNAHEVWLQAPDDQKSKALLGGFLLSRARDWLMKHPNRFLSGEMAVVRAFVVRSGEAEDAEHVRARRTRERIFRGAIAAAIVFAFTASFSLWQYFAAQKAEQNAISERDRANQERLRADQNLADAQLTQSLFLADLSAAELKNDDAGTALLIALEALPSPRDGISRPYAPEAELALSNARQQLKEIALLAGHADDVNAAVFSPDNRWVVTASSDKTARIWRVETGETIAVLPHGGEVLGVRFSDDGRRLATAWSDGSPLGFLMSSSDGGGIGIWDTTTWKTISELPCWFNKWIENSRRGQYHCDVLSFAFDGDGRRIVMTSAYIQDLSGSIDARIRDAKTGTTITLLKPFRYALGFNTDGRRVTLTDGDGQEEVVDADSGKPIGTQGKKFSDVVGHSPNGRRVAVQSDKDKTTKVYDSASGVPISIIKHWITGNAVFSPDARRLAATFDDRTGIWDAGTGEPVTVLNGHVGAILSAAFSSDGRHVVTASADKTARIWNADYKSFFPLEGHIEALSHDGRRVATSDGKIVRIWDLQSGTPAVTLAGHQADVRSVAFSANGQKVVTASDDKTARVWDTETGKLIVVLTGHQGSVASATFSRDGRRIVTASDDRTARIWDTDTGKVIAVLSEGGVLSATFTPDGRRVVTGSEDETARIWDTYTGKLLIVLRDAGGEVWLSPDGRRLVTSGKSMTTARLWDAATGALVSELSSGFEFFAKFSPDGRRFVTSGGDRLALFDAETGRRIAVLEYSYTAAFSSDNRRVMAVTEHGARVWDADTGKLIVTLGSNREFDSAEFSPDGRRIVTASSERVRIWDVATGKPIGLLELGGRERFERAERAVFNADGSRVVVFELVGDYPGRPLGRLWPVFRDTQGLIEDAKAAVPRCLTADQRAKAFLRPEPPSWCIELEKWPYQTQDWKQWLGYRKANQNPPLPYLPEWKAWVEAHPLR